MTKTVSAICARVLGCNKGATILDELDELAERYNLRDLSFALELFDERDTVLQTWAQGRIIAAADAIASGPDATAAYVRAERERSLSRQRIRT